MSAAEYRDTAPSILRLGAGADAGPGTLLLLTACLATSPYVGLAYVGSDSVVRDSVHGRVRMDPLAGSVFREGLVMVPCIIDRVSFSSM